MKWGVTLALLTISVTFGQCPVPEARSGFRIPLNAENLTLGWDFAEEADGYTCGWVYHPGIDWNIPIGQGCDSDRGWPVLAAADGKVRYVNSSSWGGIVIEHLYQNEIWYTQYGHVQGISVDLGDCITKGEQIAEIGRVGLGVGDCAHLHFEVRSPQHPNPTLGHYWNCSSPGLGNIASVNSWYRNPEIFVAEHPAYLATIGQGAETPNDAEKIENCYEHHGGEGTLGVPQGPVFRETNGQLQLFTLGGSPVAITLRDGANEALLIYGAIYNKWASLGRGYFEGLGYPITEEGIANPSPYQYPPNSGQHTEGVYVQFEQGTINHISNPVGHPYRGATHAVYGPIYTRFALGGYSAWHGFPISDILPWQTGYRMLVEEGGYIYTPDNGPAYFVSTTNPRNLVTILTNNLRALSRWTMSSSIATTVQIFRRNLNLRNSLDEPELMAILPAATTEFLDSSVVSGHQYAYSVVALAETTASPPSNESFVSLDEESWDYRIIANEYYFDTDPGEGMGYLETFTPNSQFSFAKVLNLSGLNTGNHIAYFRCLDSRGNWSAPRGKNFYLSPPSSVSYTPFLTLAEYYFNSDPGIGNGEYFYFNPAQKITLADQAFQWNVEPGQSTLYMRVRDTEGRWSAPRGRDIYVIPGMDGQDGFVAGVELFFDSDPGVGMGIPLQSDDGIFDEKQETTFRCQSVVTLSQGWHMAFVRVKSSSDTWSEAVSDSFFVNQPVSLNLTMMFESEPNTLLLIWNSFPGADGYLVRHTDNSTETPTEDSIAVTDTTLTIALQPNELRGVLDVTAQFCAPDSVGQAPKAPAPLHREVGK